MTSRIQPVSPVQGSGGFAAPEIAPVHAIPSEASQRQNADLRLIIEEDEASGTIVYKTLDRRTGEVIRQLPREEVVRLRDLPTYAPGDVADSLS